MYGFLYGIAVLLFSATFLQKYCRRYIVITMLHTTIQAIQSLDNLEPSPRVNKLFTQLVRDVVAEKTAQISDATRKNMRTIAAIAETKMEEHWAQKIIASHHPHEILQSFPYLHNYRELVRREIALIEKSGYTLSAHTRMLMIGTGPLPLTGLELMAQRDVTIDHADISLAALALCSLVGNRLNLTCGHVLGDGAKITLNHTYDVIFIAALAGETATQKQAIINNILPALTKEGRIVLRSAHGTRTLLYPGIPATAFNGVVLLEEYHPDDDIINSVFVYKKERA
jgi:hypothetical protein